MFIDVSTRSDGSTHASARGLVTCSSVWCCPVCSAHIRAERQAELLEGGQNHRDLDGGLAFLTLTVQHTKADTLDEMLDVLYSTWRKLLQSRGFRDRRDALGIVGFVRALEVTYSTRTGWHPHLHVLMFTRSTLTPDQRDDLHGYLEDGWIARLRKVGRYAARGGIGVDLRVVKDDVRAFERIAGYAIKAEGMSWELVRGDVKRGRGASLTPMTLLDAAEDGEAFAIRAWREYEEATRRRRAIEWSRGLRALVGLREERPDEKITDDEVADSTDVVETVTVAVLSGFEWRCLVEHRTEYQLLRVCEGKVEGAHYFDVVREAVDAFHARRSAKAGRSPG